MPQSKWKQEIYSRSSRNQRSLLRVSTNHFCISKYFPILNNKEKLIAENKELQFALHKLLEKFKKLSDVGGTNFTEATPFNMLDSIMKTALQNMGKDKHGFRYKNKNVVKFAAYVCNMSNATLYEIFQKNLGFPSRSTLQPIMKEISSPITEGDFRWKELNKYLDTHGLPRAIWVAEDGTRIVSRIEYDPKSNQIIGFVPKLGSNGYPITQMFDATSAEVIRHYFEAHSKSNYAYVIMAQPLSDAVPAFCLCVFGTNNCFSHEDVLLRWNTMEVEAESYNIKILGFSSDADTRLLKAMRARAFPETTDNALVWDGWYAQSLNQQFSFIQDTVHIGTKMRTRFLKPSIILPMGKYVVSSTHLRTVIEDFNKLEHGLTEKDLNATDKMNFKAVEHMTDHRVITLLDQVHGAPATKQYLELVNAVLCAFLVKNLTPSRRIYLMWKAIFFFRIWRKWLQENGYSTSKNFLTSFTYFCLELNAHAVIALVRKFREEGTPSHLMMWLLSSQCCEKYFKVLRSFTPTFSTIVNVSMYGFLGRSRKIHLQSELAHELQGEVIFPREVKKLKMESAIEEIMNTEGLPSDTQICDLIRESRKAALVSASKLGMNPILDADISPTPLFVYHLKNKKREVVSQEEIEKDLVSEDSFIGIQEDAAFGDLSLEVPEVALSPSSPFLMYTHPNGKTQLMRKTTYLWMLSSGSQHLSSDRQVRVATPSDESCFSKNYNFCHVKEPSTQETVKIGDWCAFKFEGDIIIGIILAFSYLTGKGKSVQYSAQTAPTKKPATNARGLGCLCHYFETSLTGMLVPVHLKHDYFDIANYVCSMPRPLSKNNQLFYPALVVGALDALVDFVIE